jgi:hypothetical protein
MGQLYSAPDTQVSSDLENTNVLTSSSTSAVSTTTDEKSYECHIENTFDSIIIEDKQEIDNTVDVKVKEQEQEQEQDKTDKTETCDIKESDEKSECIETKSEEPKKEEVLEIKESVEEKKEMSKNRISKRRRVLRYLEEELEDAESEIEKIEKNMSYESYHLYYTYQCKKYRTVLEIYLISGKIDKNLNTKYKKELEERFDSIYNNYKLKIEDELCFSSIKRDIKELDEFFHKM